MGAGVGKFVGKFVGAGVGGFVGAGVGCYCTKTVNRMSQQFTSVKYIRYSYKIASYLISWSCASWIGRGRGCGWSICWLSRGRNGGWLCKRLIVLGVRFTAYNSKM